MRCLAVIALVLAACGGAPDSQRAEGWHEVLDGVTKVVDPAYEASVVACNATERVIVVRTGSTQGEDLADLAKIRGVCNKVFASFESARQAQAFARELVEQARSDASVLVRAATAVEAFRQAAEEAAEAWDEAGPVLNLVHEGTGE